MKTRYAAAVLAAPLLTVAAPAVAAADPAPVLPTGIVTEVVDGDTVHVLDATRGDVTVRILGIDTPETKKPGYTVGCWGPEASGYARAALLGQPVAVVSDPTQATVDKYGRTLAYLVRPDGFNYSVEAARAGAANPTCTRATRSAGPATSAAPPTRPVRATSACGARRATATLTPAPSILNRHQHRLRRQPQNRSRSRRCRCSGPAPTPTAPRRLRHSGPCPAG